MDNYPDALTVMDGELHVGGGFALAGNKVSAFWARWGASQTQADFDCDHDVDGNDVALFESCASGPDVYFRGW